MLLLQEIDFEVIHLSRAQYAMVDYLSILDSRKQPIGVDDEFPNAALFAITNEDITALIEQSEWTTTLSWSWYEEMFHFLNIGEMPTHLSRDQRKWLALRSPKW